MSSYVPLDQFILFGDSITQGSYDQSKGFALAAELQNAYVRRLDIINRGYSGYNSDAALEVISKIIPPPEQAAVKFLTIWFGANDANTSPTQTQHVPLPRFISNLRSILTHPSITAHAAHVILLTTPPFEESVLEEFREAWGYTGRVRQAIDAAAYAAATRNLGAEMGVPVLDVWGLFMEPAGWKEGDVVLPGSKAAGKSEALAELLVDGLHLSPKGYKVVFDGLIALIKERWPDFPPYKMPFAVKVGWERELGDQLWDVNNDP